MASPEHFLASQSGKPATVNKSGDWEMILGKEKLHDNDVIAQEGGDNDVSITSDNFWGLVFSSAGNSTVFEKPLSVNALHNNASVGDKFDSGVMVLSSGKPDPLSLQGDGGIWKAFGIKDSTSSPGLQAFLNAVDSTGVLKAKLHSTSTLTSYVNALWCLATAKNYEIVVRLTFDLATKPDDPNGPLGSAISWVNKNLGVSISLSDITEKIPSIPDILITLTNTKFHALGSLETSQTYSLSYQFSIVGFDCSVDFSESATVVLLSPTEQPTTSFYSSILDAVGSPQGLDRDKMPSRDSSDLFSKFFSQTNLNLWYVHLTKDAGSSTPLWGVALLGSWVVGAAKTPVVVSLAYDSTESKFSGELILARDLPSISDQRLPGYDRRVGLPHKTLIDQGIDPDQLPRDIDLWDLLIDHGTAPKSIPHRPKGARVSYQTSAAEKQSIFEFVIDIAAEPPPGQTDEAPSGFVWNEFSVNASIKKSAVDNQTKSSTKIIISSKMTLNPKNNPNINPALLGVDLTYNSSDTGEPSEWSLHGSASDVSVALLADFFDEGCKDGAMAVLGNINLSSLDMFYTYTSGIASSFLITAVLKLGDLELDLSYQYVSALHKGTAAVEKWGKNLPKEVKVVSPPDGKTEWAFEAYLRTSSPKATIASIAESISPGMGANIPSFVGKISVAPKGDPTNSPVKLRYSGDSTSGSALVGWISIGAFNMTFVQFRSTATGGKTPTVKRILRISADQIPMLDDIPLVNQLPQPFDHLEYLWVEDDDATQTDKTRKGFTRTMIQGPGDTSVNTKLATLHIPPIQLKESKTPQDEDLVLQAGHHFVIVSNGKVVLDHVFQNAKEDKTESQVPTARVVDVGHVVAGDIVSSEEPDSADEAAVTKGSTNSKAGPLTISGLSLQYKDGSLFVGLDATLELGPLTFSVIGFTLEILLKDITLDKLGDIIKKHLRATIHGLEAGLSKDPLTLKGVFIHDSGVDPGGETFESFRGGIAVGFKAWNVLAVGEYKIVTLPRPFKSVFIYGKLDGPLVTLAFATISGVRVGFGFNSAVFLPTADKLYTFPFISDNCAAGAGNDPMQVLNRMLLPQDGNPAYVYTKEGGCWFCAGMTITCFDCLTLTAALMFQIDTRAGHSVSIALLADGVFQMPPEAPPDVSLFYVEILIKIELNFGDGYIAADSALAPASHVYVPQARLTGGASFYSWFGSNTHAGDWVVTIGGYHRGYEVPSHYPNPARLGLSFIVGNNIQVVGQGYAAVTPKCAMAGGQLHMSLSVGPVSAYCDVVLDVFVNFKPFYFIAEMRLSVGVECDIDILFIHIHISISIGADLKVWGPNDFGGIAHVDFWFFGFDIEFGASVNTVLGKGIPLLDFYEMIRTPGPPSEPRATDQTSAKNPYITQHKYSIEAGLYPLPPTSESKDFPNTGAATEWMVQAGTLQFRIDCDFAVSSAIIVTDENDERKNFHIKPAKPLKTISSFPMRDNGKELKSEVKIRIYSMEGGLNELMSGFKGELVLKQAAGALWRKYDVLLDPLFNSNTSGLKKGTDPTIELCQGIRILPPDPMLDQCPIVDFDATAAMQQIIGPVNLAASEKEQSSYLGALFEPSELGTKQWSDFGDYWTGNKEGQVGGLNKSEIRGDRVVGKGMLGLCAEAMSWDKRPPAEKGSKPVDGRMEWQLKSDPPANLAAQLGNYYAALPLWTTAM